MKSGVSEVAAEEAIACDSSPTLEYPHLVQSYHRQVCTSQMSRVDCQVKAVIAYTPHKPSDHKLGALDSNETPDATAADYTSDTRHSAVPAAEAAKLPAHALPNSAFAAEVVVSACPSDRAAQRVEVEEEYTSLHLMHVAHPAGPTDSA